MPDPIGIDLSRLAPDEREWWDAAEAASPEPWRCWNGYGPDAGGYMRCERIGPADGGSGIHAPLPREGDMWARNEDFAFAALARTAVPVLLRRLAACRASEEEVRCARDVLDGKWEGPTPDTLARAVLRAAGRDVT